MARQMVEKDIGFVGEVTSVNSQVLKALMTDDIIPVVATVAQDETGQALNVNADIAAGEIAAAVGAEKLILMTDVPGVLRDKDDVGTLFRNLSIRDSRDLIREGVIAGGMIPKVECCVRSLAQVREGEGGIKEWRRPGSGEGRGFGGKRIPAKGRGVRVIGRRKELQGFHHCLLCSV